MVDCQLENVITHDEADLLPISALQHFIFCPRQCALIHLEGQWLENRYTTEGNQLHEKIHQIGHESRTDLRVVSGLKLHSLVLGLYGVADMVEFRRVDTGGVQIPGLNGKWIPSPVEQKRGRPKPSDCDRAQLCAQAICLEEMLGVSVADGSIFYGRPRRREHVEMTHELRATVCENVTRLHTLFSEGKTPKACYEKKCDSCSLYDVCLPKALNSKILVRDYLRQLLQ
jgi:CRISPR-associated exonuclease Cas4